MTSREWFPGTAFGGRRHGANMARNAAHFRRPYDSDGVFVSTLCPLCKGMLEPSGSGHIWKCEEPACTFQHIDGDTYPNLGDNKC